MNGNLKNRYLWIAACFLFLVGLPASTLANCDECKSEAFPGERAKEINLAGVSDLISSDTLGSEPDLAEQIRKQLYYNEADQVPAHEENPDLGIYSRDKAAFRYLDLMYVVDADTDRVINHFSSGVAPDHFSTLFDVAERNRARDVEEFIFEQLTDSPNDESLQRSVLDVYYDRAVAEIILANEALDKASISRLRSEAVDMQVGYVETAYNLLNETLEQYDTLLESAPSILVEWSPSRDQISPRYTDPADLSQKNVASAELLFKDTRISPYSIS